ncbi:hypothetical protein M0802_004290 [Mischocyttarus mexicanus]|nr:hypothetical protein M0802_004290 [Mischocyttarus mexicanus]
MDKYLYIRRYKQEDEPYCKELAKSCLMALLNSIYFNLMITSNRFIFLHGIITYKLYSFGITFPFYLIYPVIVALATYIMLYLLFWKIVHDFQKDVFDATRTCSTNGNKCYWVAEVYQYRSFKHFRPHARYRWITEKELQMSDINTSNYEKKIVGFIGVDEYTRLGNCALLNKFLVHKDYARKGIGTNLIETVLQYCNENKYARVNLQFFEFLQSSIIFCQKLGFKYYETQSKSFLPLLRDVKIYEFSYLTNRTNKNTHAINDLILSIKNY